MVALDAGCSALDVVPERSSSTILSKPPQWRSQTESADRLQDLIEIERSTKDPGTGGDRSASLT